MKLLLVEDDPNISRQVHQALVREGYTLHTEAGGLAALKTIESFAPDLLILDLGLPDIDGTEVLRRLQNSGRQLPVLVLTARDSLNSKIDALDLGADDYLTKPFAMEELLARLRAFSRRIGSEQSQLLTHGPVQLDLGAHSVEIGGQPINLSRREYDLLRVLLENSGRVQTKQMLENKLYGLGDDVGSNAIEVHISNLRKKLPANFIQTIRGVGYTIARDTQS